MLWGYLHWQYKSNCIMSQDTMARVVQRISTWISLIGYPGTFGSYSNDSKDILKSLMIRYGFTNHPIFKRLKKDPIVFVRSLLELMIEKDQAFDKDCVALFFSACIFRDVKLRLSQARFTDEARTILCKKHLYFNVLCRAADDPKFVKSVLAIRRHVQLTAHWFFVDFFNVEIETFGHLQMFNIAKFVLDENNWAEYSTCNE
jgi:hypothetical protein